MCLRFLGGEGRGSGGGSAFVNFRGDIHGSQEPCLLRYIAQNFMILHTFKTTIRWVMSSVPNSPGANDVVAWRRSILWKPFLTPVSPMTRPIFYRK